MARLSAESEEKVESRGGQIHISVPGKF